MAKLNILGDEDQPTIVRNVGACHLFDRDGQKRTYHNLEAIVLVGEKEKRQLLLFKARKGDFDAFAYKVLFWSLLMFTLVAAFRLE